MSNDERKTLTIPYTTESRVLRFRHAWCEAECDDQTINLTRCFSGKAIYVEFENKTIIIKIEDLLTAVIKKEIDDERKSTKSN